MIVRAQSVVRKNRMPTYTFSETETDLELRIPLPTGTRRNQLSITLHDEASGANLWRSEIETAGGEERHAPRARLQVRPAFWPEPLLDGVLRGSVDARESSYQLTASGGGDAWDSLVVSLRKAPGAEGLWNGVVEGEEDHALDDEDPFGGGAAPADGEQPLPDNAARLVQRMAAGRDDARLQRRCAQACATLADGGRMHELLQAKALAQLAIGMRAHPADPEVQAFGCAVLARTTADADAPVATVEAVVNSLLIQASTAAILRHPAHGLVQLHGSRALLRCAQSCDQVMAVLLQSEGVALMTGLLQQPSPACDAACTALELVGQSGPKGVVALLQQGAAPALLAAVASPKSSRAWRRQCVKAVLPIAESADNNLLKSALASGLLPALRSMLHGTSSAAGGGEAAGG